MVSYSAQLEPDNQNSKYTIAWTIWGTISGSYRRYSSSPSTL